MFYAMRFIRNGYGGWTVGTIRVRPYKNLDSAIRAVQKNGSGFVKKLGCPQAVFTML